MPSRTGIQRFGVQGGSGGQPRTYRQGGGVGRWPVDGTKPGLNPGSRNAAPAVDGSADEKRLLADKVGKVRGDCRGTSALA